MSKRSDWFGDQFDQWELKRPRKDRGQAKFAKFIGISQAMVSRLLSDNNDIPGDEVNMKIALALGPEWYDVIGQPRPAIFEEVSKVPPELRDQYYQERRKWFVGFLKDHGLEAK
jgi:transcriptional regulator with XRE-family HTH domain